jgi:hypothetical protein
MELGFQISELDKLNQLIKYKIKADEPDPIEETIEEAPKDSTFVISEIPELKQKPLERDDFY